MAEDGAAPGGARDPMGALPAPFRPAVPEDAREIARLKDMAAGGLTMHVWGQFAPKDPLGFGGAKQEAPIAAGQVVVAGATGALRAAMLGYRLPEAATPVPEDLPALYRPVVTLRDMAPGSWYVDALAMAPGERGRGLGTRLLALAEVRARAAGAREMSLIVADSNTGARRLYARTGYAEATVLGFEPLDWRTETRAWILMRKPLDRTQDRK